MVAARNSRAVFGAGTIATRRLLWSDRISPPRRWPLQPGTNQEEVVGVDAVEGRDRYVDGEAVVGGARVEVMDL